MASNDEILPENYINIDDFWTVDAIIVINSIAEILEHHHGFWECCDGVIEPLVGKYINNPKAMLLAITLFMILNNESGKIYNDDDVIKTFCGLLGGVLSSLSQYRAPEELKDYLPVKVICDLTGVKVHTATNILETGRYLAIKYPKVTTFPCSELLVEGDSLDLSKLKEEELEIICSAFDTYCPTYILRIILFVAAELGKVTRDKKREMLNMNSFKNLKKYLLNTQVRFKLFTLDSITEENKFAKAKFDYKKLENKLYWQQVQKKPNNKY